MANFLLLTKLPFVLVYTYKLYYIYFCSFGNGGYLIIPGVMCVRSVAVSDVTPRYAADWCTRVYKNRLDRTWWAESLRPFEPSDPNECKKENEDIVGEPIAVLCIFNITLY